MVNQFQILLQLVKASGYRVVTVSEIPGYVGVPLTTGVMTTGIPTTGVPTTGVPTTGVPTTGVPTTGIPTTGIPTTGIPTTGVPTTGNPTTGVHSSTNPTTGSVASTNVGSSQSTNKASTQQPITTTIAFVSSTNVIAYSIASLLFVLLLL